MQDNNLLFNIELDINNKDDSINIEAFINIDGLQNEDNVDVLEYALLRVFHKEKMLASILQSAIFKYSEMKMTLTDDEITEELSNSDDEEEYHEFSE